MKNPIPLLAILLLVWIFGLSRCMSTSPCATNATTSAAIPAASSTALLINDGVSKFTAVSADNIKFPPSAFVHQPLSDSVETVYRKTAEYLKAHPERSLTITGYYKADETNTSMLPNLGLARAEDVKKILVGLGAPEKQLETGGQIRNDLNLTNNLYLGPLSYAFNTLATKDETADAADRATKLKAEPTTLYFNTDAKSVNLTKKQRTYFADLIQYLAQKPDAKVNVIGHTDSRGNAEKNKALSEDRAEFAKKYLVDNNINANQITTRGEGSTKPIDKANNMAAWTKNRRVEITIE